VNERATRVSRPVWQEPGDTLRFATQSEPRCLVLLRPTFHAGSYSAGDKLSRGVSSRPWLAKRIVGRELGVPRNAGKLLLAGLPFVAGEDARGDVDQAGNEAKDGGGGPGAAVARAVIADV
jgi:hypothetical protein